MAKTNKNTPITAPKYKRTQVPIRRKATTKTTLLNHYWNSQVKTRKNKQGTPKTATTSGTEKDHYCIVKDTRKNKQEKKKIKSTTQKTGTKS